MMIWMFVEGDGPCLSKVLSTHLTRKIEENHEKIQSG
jgi:hypothetical protein